MSSSMTLSVVQKVAEGKTSYVDMERKSVTMIQ